jgi:hypothetical protein
MILRRRRKPGTEPMVDLVTLLAPYQFDPDDLPMAAETGWSEDLAPDHLTRKSA